MHVHGRPNADLIQKVVTCFAPSLSTLQQQENINMNVITGKTFEKQGFQGLMVEMF